MSIEVKAPQQVSLCGDVAVFLSGSIEMGAAEHWQERVVRMLAEEDITFLNPRRDDWDDTWVQDISCAPFNEQVNWELDHILAANFVLVYFAPDTKAPITLAEFGYCLGAGIRPVVVCPPAFYRRGNVQIMCARHNITVHDTLESGVTELLMRTRQYIRPLREAGARK